MQLHGSPGWLHAIDDLCLLPRRYPTNSGLANLLVFASANSGVPPGFRCVIGEPMSPPISFSHARVFSRRAFCRLVSDRAVSAIRAQEPLEKERSDLTASRRPPTMNRFSISIALPLGSIQAEFVAGFSFSIAATRQLAARGVPARANSVEMKIL